MENRLSRLVLVLTLASLALPLPGPAAELGAAAPVAWTAGLSQGMPAPMIEGLRRLIDTPQGHLAAFQTPALNQIQAVDAQSPVNQGLFGLLMRRLPIGFDHELQTALSSSDPLLIQRALDALAQAHRQVQPDVAAAVKTRVAELTSAAGSMTPEELELESSRLSSPLSFFGGEAALQGAALAQLAKDRREGRVVAAESQIARALAPSQPVETPALAPAPMAAAPATAETPAVLAPAAPSRQALAPDAAIARIQKYGERLDHSDDVYDSLKLADKLTALLSQSSDRAVHAAVFDRLIGQISEDNDSDYTTGLGRVLEQAAAATPFAEFHQEAVEALMKAASKSSDVDDAGKFAATAGAIASASSDARVKDLAIDKILAELNDNSDDSYIRLLAEQTARVIESMPSAFAAAGPASAANGRLVDGLIEKLGSADDYDGERATVRALSAAARRDPGTWSRVTTALAKQLSESDDDEYAKDVIWELESLAEGPYPRQAQLEANEKLVGGLEAALGSANDYDGELALIRALASAARRDGGESMQLRVARKLVGQLADSTDDDYSRDVADELGKLASASPFASVRQAAIEGLMKAAQDDSDPDQSRRFVTNVGPIAAAADPAVQDKAVALLSASLKEADHDAYVDELKDQLEIITGQEPVVDRPARQEETQASPASAPGNGNARSALRLLLRIIELAASLALSMLVMRFLFN